MKLTLAFVAVFALMGSAFAQTTTAPKAAPAKKADAKAAKKTPAKTAKTEKIVTVCAVTGEDVKDLKTAEKSAYKGVTYYFCCQGCKPQFDKDPAKFAKTMASKVKEVPVKKS